MTDELVQRLRATHEGPRIDHGCELCMGDSDIAHDAADEIERLRVEVAALKEAAEPRILSMQVRDSGLDMELYGTACRALVESFAEEFQKGGGVNYLECRFTSRTVMPDESFVVTVQRTEGKTPHQLRQEAESALAALRKRVEESMQIEIGEDGWISVSLPPRNAGKCVRLVFEG